MKVTQSTQTTILFYLLAMAVVVIPLAILVEIDTIVRLVGNGPRDVIGLAGVIVAARFGRRHRAAIGRFVAG